MFIHGFNRYNVQENIGIAGYRNIGLVWYVFSSLIGIILLYFWDVFHCFYYESSIIVYTSYIDYS